MGAARWNRVVGVNARDGDNGEVFAVQSYEEVESARSCRCVRLISLGQN